MSSFRVKTTHKLLEKRGSSTLPKPLPPTYTLFDAMDGKAPSSYSSSTLGGSSGYSVPAQTQSKPKTGSDGGMAVRVSPIAEPDHM